MAIVFRRLKDEILIDSGHLPRVSRPVMLGVMRTTDIEAL
jgi:hypothetical protein